MKSGGVSVVFENADEAKAAFASVQKMSLDGASFKLQASRHFCEFCSYLISDNDDTVKCVARCNFIASKSKLVNLCLNGNAVDILTCKSSITCQGNERDD